jgi:hypothetical protein
MLKGLSDQRRVSREPAALVGVAARSSAAGAASASISAAAAAAAAVWVRRALPAPLVVARQAPAAAFLDVVELGQLVEPEKCKRLSRGFSFHLSALLLAIN